MRVVAFLCALAVSVQAIPARAADVRVRFDRPEQEITGFGAFGAARVWWDPPPHFDEAFLGSVVDDLGASLVRTQLYWDGEPENDDADPMHEEAGRFRFDPASDNGKQFAYLKRLHERGVRILVSVWTPPVWMKKGANDTLAPFCHGQCAGSLDPELRAEYAEYLVAYLRAFRREVGVWPFALSIQNEPLFPNAFESCVYTAGEYAATLRVVGERLEREKIDTRLFGPEHMGDFDWNRSSGFFAALLDDPATLRHLDAFAVHGYLNGFQPDYGSGEGWKKTYEFTSRARTELWMTETSEADDATWSRAFLMAKALHFALALGRVNAWVYWAFEGRITSAEGPRPLHHVLRHWFRHVRPGARQVAVENAESGLFVTGFRHADRAIVVVLNDAEDGRDATFEFVGAPPSETLGVYRTIEGGLYERLADTSERGFEFPARSLTTFVAEIGPGVGTKARAGDGAVAPPDPGAGRPNEHRGLRCGCEIVGDRSQPVSWSLAAFAALALIGRARFASRSPGSSARRAP